MYGYESRQRYQHEIDVTADDLSVTGDGVFIPDIVSPITVLRIGAVVTTAIVSTGGVVIDFDRRILTGSNPGRVDKLNAAADATITITSAAAAGKVFYKDITPTDLNPGDQIVPEVITAATTSGACRYFVEYINREEVAGNLTDMVASA